MGVVMGREMAGKEEKAFRFGEEEEEGRGRV